MISVGDSIFGAADVAAPAFAAGAAGVAPLGFAAGAADRDFTATRGVTVVFSVSGTGDVAGFGEAAFGVTRVASTSGGAFGADASASAVTGAGTGSGRTAGGSDSTARRAAASGLPSDARVTGISPVSSATEMPPLAPLRRRPPARVPTFWPLRANSSATEICPVSLLRFSLIRLPPPVRQPCSYRASGESGLPAMPRGRSAAFPLRGHACWPLRRGHRRRVVRIGPN